MLGKQRLLIPTIIIILSILISLPARAELLQTYQGTLDPPSDEQWQQILEHRNELHACRLKTQKYQEYLKSALVRGITEPTSNQYKYDVRYYKMDIELNFGSSTIDGYIESILESTYDGLNSVDFNLSTTYGGLYVSAVYLNGSPISNYTHANDLLTILLGQTFDSGEQFTMKVVYSGPPGFDGSDGMEFYYWSEEVAYTNCEPWGARLWWPCKDFPFDKPDSMDIFVTHPYNHTLVSNGVLVSSVNNGDGTKTTHWHEKYPIATYLVQLGCTNYNKYTDSWQYESGQYMPIENYSYPGISSGSQYYSLYFMINYIKPSLEALSYYFTLYPFVDEKYGHNHYGWGGAMEHQTLTSISPYFNSEYVIAHELGHQWAGDKITCINFHHMWLNEGFASYSEVLYYKYHYGEPYARDWLESQKHLNAGTPYVEDLVNDDMFDNITVYDKGSWLVYMLHGIFGDDDFLTAMDNYFNDPNLAFGVAHTNDLEAICSEVYGSDMSWFFDAWVYQAGNPEYVYSYMYEENTEKSGYDTYLLIRQVQDGGAFTMPIDVHVFAGAYDSAFTVFNNQRGQVWLMNLPNPPDSFWVDRDEKILRTVTYDPEFRMSMLAQKQVDTAYIGTPYHAIYSVVAGVPDYTWVRVGGQFPYGLVLTDSNYTAHLSGTPTWASSFTFKLQVSDSDEPPVSDTMSFTVIVLEGQAPEIPTLIAPEDDLVTSDNTPEFIWSSTAGSGGTYTLQYSGNSSFTGGVTSFTGLTDTSHTVLTEMPDGIWYWRVQALSDQGTPSGYQLSPFSLTITTGGPEMAGDCNNDGDINVSDAVYIINYVFVGGPPPNPMAAGDVNCDTDVNVSDAVYIINYVFTGGDEPCMMP
jgi:aminopeptidase N